MTGWAWTLLNIPPEPIDLQLYPGVMIDADRLATARRWEEFLDRHGELPPLLVTAAGMIVDGNTRALVLYRRSITCWACIVEPAALGRWSPTGRVVRVRFPRLLWAEDWRGPL